MDRESLPVPDDCARPRVDTFRSLRHRNYRLYFFGQIVSFTGSWMQNAALMWLVYEATGDPLWPPMLLVAQVGPTLLFGPLGGSLADRVSKRKLVAATQLAFLVTSLILVGLVAGNLAVPFVLLGFNFCNGLIQSVDLPARLAFVPDLRAQPVRPDERMGEPPRFPFELSERLRQPATEGVIIKILKRATITLPELIERGIGFKCHRQQHRGGPIFVEPVTCSGDSDATLEACSALDDCPSIKPNRRSNQLLCPTPVVPAANRLTPAMFFVSSWVAGRGRGCFR
jgi:hypothetical protein